MVLGEKVFGTPHIDIPQSELTVLFFNLFHAAASNLGTSWAKCELIPV